MSPQCWPAVLGLVVTVVSPLVEPVGTASLTPQAGSRIWVTGTSTVKSWACSATRFDLLVDATKPNAASAVVAGERAVGAVDLKVPIAAMDCRNSTMNEHMRTALKAVAQPVIGFSVVSYTLVKAGDGAAVTLNGSLSIGGVQKAVTMSARAGNGGSGVLRLTGTYDLHMEQFGLKPPSLFLGSMTVGELVQVHFDLLLGGQQPVAAAPGAAPTVAAAPAVAKPVAAKPVAAKPVAEPAASTTAPKSVAAQSPPTGAASPPVVPSTGAQAAPPGVGTQPAAVATALPAASPADGAPAASPSAYEAFAPPSAALPALLTAAEVRTNGAEAPPDTSEFDAIRLTLGAAITQDFQFLNHENTATPVVVGGVNTNQLIGIGAGFNTAMINVSLSARLAKGIRVDVVTYLSSRHLPGIWVKGGFLQVDGSPLPLPVLDNLLKNITVRIGQFEANYGDAHFRRTDGGNGIDNPFVGNLIMDAFTTDIGADVTWRRGNWLVMAGFTGGAPDGQVTAPGGHSLAYLAKVGYDTTTPGGTRLRLTGSMYTVGQATANALYTGGRAGSHYFDVMENTLSSERANAWSGNVQPGFTHHVTAFVLNPLVKYADLELFGNFETATGGATAGGPDRTWRQQSVDAVYRVLDDLAYVAARYNLAAGTIVGAPRDVEVHRVQLGMGLFISRNFLAKLELVRQTHQGYPGDNILNGGRFSGVMLEGAVKF